MSERQRLSLYQRLLQQSREDLAASAVASTAAVTLAASADGSEEVYGPVLLHASEETADDTASAAAASRSHKKRDADESKRRSLRSLLDGSSGGSFGDRSSLADGQISPFELPEPGVTSTTGRCRTTLSGGSVDLSEIPNERTLPNDSCTLTRQLERTFLAANGLEPYTHGGSTVTRTVLYSRTLRAHYYYGRDGEGRSSSSSTSTPRRAGPPAASRSLLTNDDLDVFAEFGHTLSVDNSRSYIRTCSFDLDCLCRTGIRTSHLGESLVEVVREKLIRMLSTVTNQREVICVVWNKECGYHLYTNVSVSLLLHVELGERLKAEFSNRDLIIELPTYMPLPYSAKTLGEPYRPLLIGQPSVPVLGSDPYYDRFEFKRPPCGNEDVLVATLQKRGGTTLLVANRMTTQKYGAPKLSNVTDVRFENGFVAFVKPLQDYIAHVNASSGAFGGTNPSANRSRAISDFPARIVALCATEKFSRFIEAFNTSHFNERTTLDSTAVPDYSRFVQISAEANGAMYLQHYLVALHKVMRPITDDDFKSMLEMLYVRPLKDDPGVKRLVERYDVHTFNSYNDTYDAILRFLSLVYIHELSLEDNLETYINKMMCDALNVQDLESWSLQYSPLRGGEKEKRKYQALNAYIDVMSSMMYLINYNGKWYVYTNSGHHTTVNINDFPCISLWLNLDDGVKRYIGTQVSRFVETNMWSNCHFMFATQVGAFNSLTGLYSAKVPLLRFTKSRNYALWEPERPLKMSVDQNREILKYSEIARRFADTVYDRITELFLHFQIIPAIVQLPKVYNVDDEHMCRFFELFESHEGLDEAHFLVELYPVDHKFVYVIMYLYSKFGLRTLLNYNKLEASVFKFKTNVTGDDWSEYFTDKLSSVTIDSCASDHMARLLSLRDAHLDVEINRDFCLYAVLISVVMIKCFAFRPLLEAFGVLELPVCADKERVPEHFRDVEYRTTLNCYKRIMDMTVERVYGKDLTEFEKTLAHMTVQLGMSVCFDPDTARELINMVSAVYVPRNLLKKMLILTGPQGTGKSFFCDMITELNMPFVGRFQDVRSAVQRSNITTRTNVTVINEASTINPHHMKSVTGNDGESAQVFYSQTYEMQNFQSLVYGATNGVIVFKECDKNVYNVDRTTVDRIHAITLNGVQIHESDERVRCDSLFMMVALSRFFTGLIETKKEVCANALGWLAYVTYYNRRDRNNAPRLNTSNPDVLAYQKLVYYKNNSLYAFLVQSGITEEPGFSIDTRQLINAVQRSIDEKVHAKTFSTYRDFETNFNLHYNVELKNVTRVAGLQFAALVDHTKNTMSTTRCEGHGISEGDLECRLEVYGTKLNQSNAREFFKRMNGADFDPLKRVFTNVKFVHDTPNSYAGNEIDSCDSPNNRVSSGTSTSFGRSATSRSGYGGFDTVDDSPLPSTTTFVLDSV